MWRPPGRNELAAHLLPAVRKLSYADVKRSLPVLSYLCFSADGWTDVSSRSVINVLLEGDMPFVVCSVRLGA